MAEAPAAFRLQLLSYDDEHGSHRYQHDTYDQLVRDSLDRLSDEHRGQHECEKEAV